MKRKDLGREPSLSRSALSASLTLWLWEQDKSLRWIWVWYMNSRCSVSSHTVEKSSSHEHPTSTKEKCGLKRKTWGREAFVQGTAANLNSATAKTITSASWKLGDNLFMLCCLSNLILLPHLDSLISKFVLFWCGQQICWAFTSLFLLKWWKVRTKHCSFFLAVTPFA